MRRCAQKVAQYSNYAKTTWFPCAKFGEALKKLGLLDELEELKKLYPDMRVR
jgi:hypothetical protein